MGFASIAASQSGLVRSVSEISLLKTENYKKVATESKLTTARAGEQNALAKEADEGKQKVYGVFFDKKTAELAKEIANVGKISAIVGAVGSIAAGFGGSSGSALGGISAIVSAGFSLAGAFLAAKAAKEEVEMMTAKYNDLSDETKEDKKMVDSLNAFHG